MEDVRNVDATLNYHISAACGCNTGRFRKNNEDNFYFDGIILPEKNTALSEILTLRRELDRRMAFGVFDGMGGETDGETAAFICAHTLQSVCEQPDVAAIPPKRFLCQVIDRMNEAVCQYAVERYISTGSTATILYFSEGRAYVCSVGDSKIFRMRNGELFPVTKEHFDAGLLFQSGIARSKPRLTQYIGLDPADAPLSPYIARANLKAGDLYLICSDGLTDMLSYADIYESLRSDRSLQSCAEDIIAAALRNGGKDNITVILVRVDE